MAEHALGADFFSEQQQRAQDDWIAPIRPEALYGIAGDFVHLIAPQTEASDVALLTNFLIIAGVLFGREAYVLADGARHYPAEFLIHIGDTGKSRKGTAGRRTLAIANAVEEDFSKNHMRSGLSSGEGLIKALQQGKQLGQYRFLGYLPEFGSLLTCARREGNTISAVLRQSWDADLLEVTTKTDPLSVSDYFLSVVGHITPEELLNGLSSVDLVNGMANRFLFCKVRRSKFLPEGGADVNVSPIVVRVRSAVERAQGRGRMQRDQEAKELWAEVYPQLADQPRGLKGSLCSRAESHVLRLSMIYALLDSAGTIGIQHLRAALAVWDYCERSIADIFKGRLGDPDADKILDAMTTGPKTMSELFTVFGRNRPSEWLQAKLAAMVEAGLLLKTTKRGDRKGNLDAWDKKH